MWLFCYFNFERNYDVSKSKSPYILFSKTLNCNRKLNGNEIGKSTHSFSASAHIALEIKSKTEMS